MADTLKDLIEIFGPERKACVARELTKLHEEVVRGTLGDLAARFAEGARGEVTLIMEGGEGVELSLAQAPLDEVELGLRLEALVREGRRPREIAAMLAPVSVLPRRELYARALTAREAYRAPNGEPEEAPS